MQKLQISDKMWQIQNVILCRNGYKKISYDLLNKMSENDMYVFDKLFLNNNYADFLHDSIKELLDTLYKDYPHTYKKVQLYDKLEYELSDSISSYILSLYATGGNKAYEDFTDLFIALIRKLRIHEYKYIPEQVMKQRLYDCFDIINKNNRVYIEKKELMNESNYEAFFSGDYTRATLPKDRIKLFVEAEKEAYDELLNFPNSSEILWLSRDYADGYGCDLLKYDREKNQEMLVEVKGCNTGMFYLTDREYNTILNTVRFNNSYYYIYQYFVNFTTDFSPKYKYIKNKGIFQCSDNSLEYYILDGGRDRKTIKQTEESLGKMFSKSKHKYKPERG